VQSRRSFLQASVAAGILSGASKTDLAWLSLHEASDLVRRKSVSPVELTQTCLARIERLNPALNAFITVTADEAMREAREAEAEIQKGRWKGPLHGIPIALKDLIDTAGVKTTAASGTFKDRVPTEDAEVVSRLKGAGAVFLGKLNMHEFAYGITSAVSYFGAVHNPWKTECSAGGSSGGSAAAVAAGLCYGALGSDTSCSIRLPASYCGITGLKPTYGRVSTRGVVPLSWSLDHVGPMTRSVLDSALMLQVIAGYDPEEITSAEVPVPQFSVVSSKRPRLGVPREQFWKSLDPEVEASMNQALGVLSKLTAETREMQVPLNPSANRVLGPEAYAYHAAYVDKTPDLYQAQTLRNLRAASSVTAATYIEARRDLDRIRRNAPAVFSNVDLLVMPTVPLPPPLLGAPDDEVAARLRNTAPFDMNGMPAISIPCGFTKDGLPIGMQIVGPPWGEAAVLQLAHAYEQVTDWHQRHP
jgi:aspartyl-tRNA(Asn)/glutamyl-tRNA(Gln) amidotransferase subunit A